jgi:hypothetical protein
MIFASNDSQGQIITLFTNWHIKSIFFHYIYPVIIFFAAFQNLICSVILAQRELRRGDPFFQYSLVNSIVSTVGTFLVGFMFLTECDLVCATAHTRSSQVYSVYVIGFVVSTLYVWNLLIHLSISFNMYFNLNQKFRRLRLVSPLAVLFGTFIWSLANGVVMSLNYKAFKQAEIVFPADNPNSADKHYHARFRLDNNLLGYMGGVFIFSNELLLILLISVNVLILAKSRQLMKRKKSQRRRASKKAQRKVQVLFLWISFMFGSSRLLYSVYHLMLILFPANSLLVVLVQILHYTWTSLVYSSYFFVYFKTNKKFKRIFYRIFLRKG